MTELLPCPFCGAAQDIDQDIADTGVFWVRCSECCAEGAAADTKEDAAQAWNTRTSAGNAGQPDFKQWAEKWHQTCEAMMTMAGLSSAGSPEEMLAEFQASLSGPVGEK